MASIVVPPAFPVVGFGVAAAVLLNAFQQVKVGLIRNKAGVKYPTLYVTEAEANVDPIKMQYNCTQRAHANTLETIPYLLSLFAFSGMFHPKAATACMLVWVFGKFFYTIQYASGKPEARNGGLARVSYIGFFGLFLTSIGTAVQKTYQLYM